jgi:hypothetical protein
MALVATLTGCTGPGAAPVNPATAEAAIRDVSADLASATTPKDLENWCSMWADDVTACLDSLVIGAAWLPASTEMEMHSRVTRSGTVVVTVTGILSNGRTFTSDVEFLHGHDDRVRAVDPVFWVPREIRDAIETSRP